VDGTWTLLGCRKKIEAKKYWHRLLHSAAMPFLGYGKGESNGQNNRFSVS